MRSSCPFRSAFARDAFAFASISGGAQSNIVARVGRADSGGAADHGALDKILSR
jgi:hypothetical protein